MTARDRLRDSHAADRLLKAAVRHAVELTKAGDDPRPVLATAGEAAALLLEVQR